MGIRSFSLLILVAFALGSSACGSKGAASAGPDGGAPDSVAGSGGSSGAAGSGGAGGSTGAAACDDHAFGNAACWSSFDLQRLTSNTQSFTGSAFDGRYLYLVNSARAVSLRHDTQGELSAGWTGFEPATLPSGPSFFDGAAFDGRYVYFVPAGGISVRCDTHAAFNVAGSWTTADLTAMATAGATTAGADKAGFFFGAAFDGRYLYFAPSFDDRGNMNTVVLRFDTQGDFAAPASWALFDATAADARAGGYAGAAFDGRYVYLVPVLSGSILRLDTQGTFTAATAWAAFDTGTLPTPATRFSGAAFDGRHVYFVPSGNAGVMVRYDSQAGFANAASWETMATTTLGNTSFAAWSYAGATFDGRFVYFVPTNGSVLRFDTQGVFTTAAAWQVVDFHDVGLRGGSYRGASFDGRYVYLIPTGSLPLLRFDARATPSLPPRSGASFY